MSTPSVSRALRHFFGAYFHEDWVLEADDWRGIVAGYVRDEEPAAELLRTLAQEIYELNAQRTEPDVAQLVRRALGANYYPLPECTYKEWLMQVAAELRRQADAIEGGAAAGRDG